MNPLKVFLLLFAAILAVPSSSSSSSSTHNSSATLCPAVRECLSRLDTGGECKTLPVPQRAILPFMPPGQTYRLLKLRQGVWEYRDLAYNTLIIRHNKRLVLVDFPDSDAGSNKPDGSRTHISDATQQVLAGVVPSHIDMIYSHSHFDHIGRARAFHSWARGTYPAVQIRIWGTKHAKEMIEKSVTKRAIPPQNIVREGRPRRIRLRKGLEVHMDVLGGHTGQDLAIHIPRHANEKGVLMFVDVVFPKWASFVNLALSTDVAGFIQVHRNIMRFDFDYFLGGHMAVGDRSDVEESMEYVMDLKEIAKAALEGTSDEETAAAGSGKFFDPNAKEYSNLWYLFIGVIRGIPEKKCARMMIEKWGCRIGGLATVVVSHCFTMIEYLELDY